MILWYLFLTKASYSGNVVCLQTSENMPHPFQSGSVFLDCSHDLHTSGLILGLLKATWVYSPHFFPRHSLMYSWHKVSPSMKHKGEPVTAHTDLGIYRKHWGRWNVVWHPFLWRGLYISSPLLPTILTQTQQDCLLMLNTSSGNLYMVSSPALIISFSR